VEREIGTSGKIAPKIRIPEEAVRELRMKIQRILCPTSTNESLNLKIIAINRIMRGWCQYYQHTSSPSYYFNRLNRVVFWQMAHWLGRKYKLSMPKVMEQFKKENTFGTDTHTMILPSEYKAKRYQAKAIHNPYLSPETALLREDWDRLMEQWEMVEGRKGSLDLKEWVYQRDKGRCGICGQHVARREADMDHKTPWSRFKHRNAANHEDNLWILHRRPCHLEKTKRDLQCGSRVP
jgi:5-methylcytosine-specific restriction endonuclease McrA